MVLRGPLFGASSGFSTSAMKLGISGAPHSQGVFLMLFSGDEFLPPKRLKASEAGTEDSELITSATDVDYINAYLVHVHPRAGSTGIFIELGTPKRVPTAIGNVHTSTFILCLGIFSLGYHR